VKPTIRQLRGQITWACQAVVVFVSTPWNSWTLPNATCDPYASCIRAAARAYVQRRRKHLGVFRSTGTHLDQGHARKAVANRTIIYCWSQIVRPRRASSVAKTSARRRRVRAHVVGTRLDDRAFSLCLIHPTRTHVNWPPYPSQACKVLVFLHFIRASSGFQLRSPSSPAASSNLPMLRPVSEMQDLCP